MRDQGGSVFRNDAAAKVAGRARYTDDLKASGMLHAVPVYSPWVRARFLVLDTEAASSASGVVRILTAKDIPGSAKYGQIEQDYAMLASDSILCEGDVVAIVVADSREHAIAASRLVDMSAEELPALTDPERALDPDAPRILQGKDTNLVNHGCVRRGDAAAAMMTCELVLSETFRTQHIEHAYMEPEAALAIPRPDGSMAIYGSMQHPYSTRRFVAAILAEPLSDIEVFNVTMGGGFGGKDDTAAIICARAALAARLTGRAVKIRYNREWSMRESYKRHPYRLSYRLGFEKSGRLRAAEIDMLADSGAYLSVTPWVNWRSTAQCCGPYMVDNVRMDIQAVATNNVFTGAMRGFGAPQVHFAMEQLMDMAAERLGLSPLDIRKINMVKQGSQTITGQVLDNHTVSLESVMERVASEIDFERKFASCSRGLRAAQFGQAAGIPRAGIEPTDGGDAGRDALYGIGIATSYRGASLGAEGMDYCCAIVNCQQDGSILLEAAIHENGQGAESAHMLILAEELGVPLSRIRYRLPSTSNIPDGGTTVATRGTLMGGGAVAVAARNLKKLMAEALSGELGCAAGEVLFKDDCLVSPSGIRIPWEKAMKILHGKCVYPYAFGSFRAPEVSWDEKTGQGDAYFTYVYSCQAVELEVDPRTGAVKLLNIVAAHDIGKAINKPMLLGQMFGELPRRQARLSWRISEFRMGISEI